MTLKGFTCQVKDTTWCYCNCWKGNFKQKYLTKLGICWFFLTCITFTQFSLLSFPLFLFLFLFIPIGFQKLVIFLHISLSILHFFSLFLSSCANCLGFYLHLSSTLTSFQNFCHRHVISQFILALSQPKPIFVFPLILPFLICPIPVTTSPSFLCIE